MARLHIVVGQPGVTLDIIAPEYCYLKQRLSRETFHNKKYKAVWLLHDVGEDSTEWFGCTMAEVYAREKGIFLISPSAENGFYVNNPAGEMWEHRLMTHIWRYVNHMFPISDCRKDNCIAGYGMGGYGAIKYALDYPERFSRVISLDGNINIDCQKGYTEKGRPIAEAQFSKLAKDEVDLFHLAEVQRNNVPIDVEFQMALSQQYEQYQCAERLYKQMKMLGYTIQMKETSDTECWTFRDRQLKHLIDIFSEEP